MSLSLINNFYVQLLLMHRKRSRKKTERNLSASFYHLCYCFHSIYYHWENKMVKNDENVIELLHMSDVRN